MRSIVSHTVVAARSCIADQPTRIRQTSILRNSGEDKVKLIFSLNQYNELTFKKEKGMLMRGTVLKVAGIHNGEVEIIVLWDYYP